MRFLREARVLPAFFDPLLFAGMIIVLRRVFFDSLAFTVLGITNSDLSEIVSNLER